MKAILEMDMPETCQNCRLVSLAINPVGVCHGMAEFKQIENIYGNKPDWRPLKARTEQRSVVSLLKDMGIAANGLVEYVNGQEFQDLAKRIK